MLPLFTTGQVKDGIDTGDLMLDLSDYMKKKDGATKIELNNLSAVVANKLDATPQHNHHIEDIKQLQSLLDAKYDKGEKYPYNTILSNPEKISYLEAPTVQTLNINGYIFYVDTNGDLMITLNNVLIGSYSNVSGKWSFETDTSTIDNVLENHGEALNAVCNATLKNITDISTNHTKINSVESIINEYIAKTDAVLKNHYDALLLLCEKHGMVDGDGDGASNISPQ
jgi:hypothetical protein